MTLAHSIVEHIKKMPESEQEEVLDFIEYLETKARERRARDEADEWSVFSLSAAMSGIEDEVSDYHVDDLKETF